MATAKVTVDDIRLNIEDYSDVNIPIYVQQLTDEEIQSAIDYIIDDFNETPPRLSTLYTIATFPSRGLLIDGATMRCFNLTAMKELRGEMQYNDGGISSTISYKFPQFTSLRQELTQKYEQDKYKLKRNLNINLCYGGVS